MMFKPSYLAVMSEQCLNHAIEIQGISREKIYIIGNSRFEIYTQKNLFLTLNIFFLQDVIYLITR